MDAERAKRATALTLKSGVCHVTETTQPTAEAEGKEKRRQAAINGAIALVSIAITVGILIWIVLTPLPAQRPFTRIGGETRVQTAIEASRLWPMSGKQAFVTVPRSETQEAYWRAAECAVTHEFGPSPLIFESQNERQPPSVAQAALYLGGLPVSGLSCANSAGAITEQCEDSNWNVLEVSASARSIRLPSWVPRCPELASTVIFAAAKSTRDAPDLAVALPLARQLSTTTRRVTVIITPPYLESDQQLRSFLGNSEQVVEDGIIIGGTTRIPQATESELTDLLARQEDAAWLQQVATALGPFGTLLIALLTLLSGWKLAQASAPIAEAVGIGLENRMKPLFERNKDKSTASENDAASASDHEEESEQGGATASTVEDSDPGPDRAAWRPLGLDGQRVKIVLRSGDVITGTLANEPSDLAGVRFLLVTDARLDSPRLDHPEAEATQLLVPWQEVLLLWEVDEPSSDQDVGTTSSDPKPQGHRLDNPGLP